MRMMRMQILKTNSIIQHSNDLGYKIKKMNYDIGESIFKKYWNFSQYLAFLFTPWIRKDSLFNVTQRCKKGISTFLRNHFLVFVLLAVQDSLIFPFFMLNPSDLHIIQYESFWPSISIPPDRSLSPMTTQDLIPKLLNLSRKFECGMYYEKYNIPKNSTQERFIDSYSFLFTHFSIYKVSMNLGYIKYIFNQDLHVFSMNKYRI